MPAGIRVSGGLISENWVNPAADGMSGRRISQMKYLFSCPIQIRKSLLPTGVSAPTWLYTRTTCARLQSGAAHSCSTRYSLSFKRIG